MTAPPPIQLELELTARAMVQRESRRARLRALLADGRWHCVAELVAAGGLRFGGRLHELRRGADGLPCLDIEGRRREGGAGDTTWEYRALVEI